MTDMTSVGSNGGVYVVSAMRTPIGKFGGALSTTPAVDLGAVAIRAAVERAGIPDGVPIDEVLMGQVLQGGAGQAPARQAALKAGLPDTTSATTINRVCGSGLKAIMLASAEIRVGDAEIAVAGGMESMNMAPYLLRQARFGYRLGTGELVDSTVADGLWCAVEDCHMGTHAERVAIESHVSREDQDRFALESHQKAISAIDEGRFEAEIAPVTIRGPKGPTRPSASTRDRGETHARGARQVEAGVRSAGGRGPRRRDRWHGHGRQRARHHRWRRRDGARVGASRRTARPQAAGADHRATPRPSSSRSGCSSRRSQGVRRLLDRIELPIEAFDLFEINEAFAAQTLADGRELGFDWTKVNVNGGAIALGHPIGASGARIVATLLHELTATGGPLWPRDPVPRRRRVGGDGLRARLIAEQCAGSYGT